MNKNMKIKIICRNPKIFLNEIINKNINIYDLNIENKYLELVINYNDLDKIDKIKYTHKIEIKNYYGLLKIKYCIKKYKSFLLTIIIGIIINILLSNMILNIEVQTPSNKLKKIIIKDLKQEGIKKYQFKISYKKKETIKKKLLKKEKDKIEWLEIEEHGTKYIIKVEPKKINKKETICNPRNIVASKKAVITKIIATTGEIKKKKQDYVEEGEVLISGFIYNKDEIVSKKCAEGHVYGETWYKVNLEIPKEYIETKVMKDKSYGLSINLLNKNIDINHRFKKYQKEEYKLINTNIIPLKINIAKYIKVKEIKHKYDINSIDNYAIKRAIKEINRKFNKPQPIISKKVLKKEIKNSKIIIEVFVALEEEITAYQDISNINIEDKKE